MVTTLWDVTNYLQHGIIPKDGVEANGIARKAKSYTLNESTLNKRGSHGVLMRCISQTDGIKLLSDIHGGVCGSHRSYRTLVGKAFRQGYYWPTALHDAKELVTKCVQCQFHSRQVHQSAQALQTISLSWPFAT